ncbi:very short patch repair endonuclease [Halobacillus mangrovi]|uniref:Very short patch repair endonuclease n=1 Tax=Halobacillus mangrovi TaxID=402384 RepID=A0A1W5ZQV0_9BACI|nr:very short patch repair endonuclease [Halobacillus mangrovi]ARI75652.1 very short patch repair endonuclease [Halobacillus mangrovi]
MGDVMSKEQRRKNMKAIKSVSKLEKIVSSELWKKGYRFRRNTKSLTGKPDISIKKYKVVIFIDSCFFHRCPLHGNMPQTNSEFWKKKLNRNVARDKEVNNHYEAKDWNLLRIWEHEIKEDLEGTVNKIAKFIELAK